MAETPETDISWQASLRPPSQVMRLARIGSFHQSRLSFMRTLLRRMVQDNWRYEKRLFEIDDKCVGRAVYSAVGPTHTYSLVAFAHDLPPEQRSDRVIATAWDCTFTLFDGVPSQEDLQRLAQNVPLQEAGRVSTSELSLSRANRSGRLWNHVVDALAAGDQPDLNMIRKVGYLMRTTAVYGSGKFGAADRVKIMDRPMMANAFRIEMLSVYLTRDFVMDLVEHAARCKGGDRAAVIDPKLRREFGIGNSTGLGMAPFLSFHPALIDSWINNREQAFARVRSLRQASDAEKSRFLHCVKRADFNLKNWHSQHPLQIEKLAQLRRDMDALNEKLRSDILEQPHPWHALINWSEDALNLEGQEQLLSLILEPYGDLVDDLASEMKANEYEAFRINGAMPLARLKQIVQTNYAWALVIDYKARENCARFWYVSQEKLEPRLGERFDEPGAEYEQPQNFGRDIKAMAETLDQWPDSAITADFTLAHPEHRHMVRRAQIIDKHPYGEIHDNLISSDMKPLDMLRCKLSFFGANKFDPRSDRWVRICMYQNAPYSHELAHTPLDDWAYAGLDSK